MIFLHLFVCQNPQQERGGALLFLPAPGEFWTRYGPAAFIFLHLKGFFIFNGHFFDAHSFYLSLQSSFGKFHKIQVFHVPY